jgi:hypothetical protein
MQQACEGIGGVISETVYFSRPTGTQFYAPSKLKLWTSPPNLWRSPCVTAPNIDGSFGIARGVRPQSWTESIPRQRTETDGRTWSSTEALARRGKEDLARTRTHRPTGSLNKQRQVACRDGSPIDDTGSARYSEDNGIQSTGSVPDKNGPQPRRPKPRLGCATTKERRQRVGQFPTGVM